MDRLYCSVGELVDDLVPSTGGRESSLLSVIRFASEFIDHDLGSFIPFTAAKRFDGNGKDILFVPPLLAVTSIADEGTSLAATDYLLYPRNKHWEDGPYSYIKHDPDGAHSVWTEKADAVVITGPWGKYLKTVVTGATVQNNPLAIGGTSLTVLDGSKVSVGMALLLETEQALVTATESPTTATTVTEAVGAGDETITLANATLVQVGEIGRLEFEQVKFLDINTTTKVAYVARGFNATKRVAHADNTVVEAYRTFTIARGINGTTAAQHILNVAISRYVAPEPVKRLCIQIAALWKKLADSQYAGRTGSVELGQVFYNDAFPRRELEELRALYNYEKNV